MSPITYLDVYVVTDQIKQAVEFCQTLPHGAIDTLWATAWNPNEKALNYRQECQKTNPLKFYQTPCGWVSISN